MILGGNSYSTLVDGEARVGISVKTERILELKLLFELQFLEIDLSAYDQFYSKKNTIDEYNYIKLQSYHH